MTPEECLEGFGLSRVVMIPREKAGLLYGLRYGQTWVWLWTLVPNQCPKGDVGFCSPSGPASDSLLRKDR